MKIPTLQCNRCQHEWYPRNPKEPKVCPKCNSPYWNKERKLKSKPMEQEKQDLLNEYAHDSLEATNHDSDE